jgi:hypothetical protein
MKTFEKQLDNLREQAIKEIQNLIKSKGVKSRHSNNKCLHITMAEHMYNLDGGRFLKEINSECLVDNSGYEYNFNVLCVENLFSVIDYLIQKYKK